MSTLIIICCINFAIMLALFQKNLGRFFVHKIFPQTLTEKVYLPTNLPSNITIHVGKYTSHIERLPTKQKTMAVHPSFFQLDEHLSCMRFQGDQAFMKFSPIGSHENLITFSGREIYIHIHIYI